jgi:uncharacterized protein YjgD (DUF1641 family)
MSDIAKIELSKDLIEPIVRAQLQASIVSAMGRADQLVAQVVNTVMNSKVGSDGNPSHYSNGVPLISWMAESAIKEAAKEAIKEWFADNKDEMKKLMRAAIQKNSKGMAESFVLSMSKAVESTYSHNLTVTIKPVKE